MSFMFGGREIVDVRLGAQQVAAVNVGAEEVWSAVKLTSLTFRSSATGAVNNDDESASVDMPADAQEGDLAIWFEEGYPLSGGVITRSAPAGWSEFFGLGDGSFGTTYVTIATKVVEPADLGSPVVGSGGTGNRTFRAGVILYTPDAPISSVTNGMTWNSVNEISGNPSPQTITTGSAATLPVLAIAVYSVLRGTFSASISPRSASPPMMTEISVNSDRGYIKLHPFNVGDTPSDIVVDMDDEATNTLISGYLVLT